METAIEKRRPVFFLFMGMVAVFAVLGGFAKTFIIPASTGSFKAPLSVHIHGAFAFSWVILFLIQATLIRLRNYRVHIILGSIGILIAIGTGITMLPVGMFVVERGLLNGEGDSAYSSIFGIVTSAILFLSFVFAAIYNRRKPESHKRWMLLATIFVIWPAWFRFRHYLPSVPRPDIWFGFVLADSFIVLAWIRDKIRYGKIHPVLLYGGLFLIIENATEVYLFNTSNWQYLSKMLYNWLLFLFP